MSHKESGCWLLKVDRIYDNVRNEPRLQAILKKLGLWASWRRHLIGSGDSL